MYLEDIKCNLIRKYLSCTSFNFENIEIITNTSLLLEIYDMTTQSSMTLTQCFQSIYIEVDDSKVGWVHEHEKYPGQWSPGFQLY